MSLNYEYWNRWRNRAKHRIVEALGGKCIICGFDKWTESLDFHHINPKEKLFNLSSLGISKGSKNWKSIVEEARKCVILCANCHRAYHSGHAELPETLIKFDESFAEYREPKKPKVKKPKKKRIQPTKIDWPSIEILHSMLEQSNYSAVGRELGVSDNAVRKHIKTNVAL